MANKSFNNVKLKVTHLDLSKDTSRSVLVSGENISHSLGKIARWYKDISWVGHTHTKSQITDFEHTHSSFDSSVNKGAENQPVYILNGAPTAITYTIKSSVPENAVFTDENVKQQKTTTPYYRPIVFGSINKNGTTSGLDATTTAGVYTSTNFYAQPSTGTLYATKFSGDGSELTNLSAANLTGTINVARLPDSTVVANSYGPAAGGTLSHGGTFDVPYVTVDKYGRLTAAANKTFTLPNQYTHPSHNAASSGLYKITVDTLGHVTAATAVVKSDITALGIPGSDNNTTYSVGTGDNEGQIKVTPSTGTAYNVSINGAIHAAIVSNGTTSTTDKGKTYGVAAVTTSPYNYAKWYVNLSDGVTSLTDGMMIKIKIPVAGSTYGVCITLDGTNFHPVAYASTSRVTTHYPLNAIILLAYDAAGTCAVYSNSASTANIEGVWRVMNMYYSDSNTVPSGYCTTAAGTAAKGATFTNYNLLAKSYMMLVIQNTNTAASALTLNVNSKGAKPIYINGKASSSTNYTLPAGSYLVYYDGTNYYLRTDGKIDGLGSAAYTASTDYASASHTHTKSDITDFAHTHAVGDITGGSNKQFLMSNGTKGEWHTLVKADIPALDYIPSTTVVLTGGSQTSTSSADGGSNVFTFNKSDGSTATFTVKNGTKGSQGIQGIRGTGFYSITTAPESYTTATGGFTPTYCIALDTVKTQSKATDILVGDQLRYSYYTYPVGYVDANYVYLGARVSIRGATGADGAAATINIGKVTTGAAGSSATVTNSGTTAAAVLDFSIPKGDKGDPGTPGPTYSASDGIKLDGTTFKHTNAITAVTTAAFKKFKYDAQGHITGTADVAAADLPSHTHTVGNIIGGTNKQFLMSNGTTGEWHTLAKADIPSLDYVPNTHATTTYGTCSTAAATAAKVVTLATNGAWTLKVGAIIAVKFTATNTAANPTLNVNNTGAKPVYYNTAVLTDANLSYAGYANRVHIYAYDGTNYVYLGHSVDNNSTYSDMKAATASAAGTHGLAPAPAAGAQTYFLRGDATWVNITPSLIGAAESSHTHSQYYDSSTSRTANTVLAAPNGSAGAATFRALVAADIPSLAASKITSGTFNAARLPASGATAGSYGPSANASPAHSGTFSVPYLTVDSYGRVTAISTKTITLPASGNTDSKVRQSSTTTGNYRGVVLGYTNNTDATTGRETDVTNETYITNKIFAQPSTGTLWASNLNAWISGTADVVVGLVRSGNSSWRLLNTGGNLYIQNNYYSSATQSWYTAMKFNCNSTNKIEIPSPPTLTGTNRSLQIGYDYVAFVTCDKSGWAMDNRWMKHDGTTSILRNGVYGNADGTMNYMYWSESYNGTANTMRFYKSDNGWVTSCKNGFRIVAGGYGAFFRNNGSDFYLLLTDKKTDGTEWTASWNGKRPFRVNLSSGLVEMSHGLQLSGGITFKTTNSAGAYLIAYDTGNNYNQDVVFQSTGSMIIGAGEAAAAIYTNNVESIKNSENMALGADGDIFIYTGANTINARKRFKLTSGGNFGFTGLGGDWKRYCFWDGATGGTESTALSPASTLMRAGVWGYSSSIYTYFISAGTGEHYFTANTYGIFAGCGSTNGAGGGDASTLTKHAGVVGVHNGKDAYYACIAAPSSLTTYVTCTLPSTSGSMTDIAYQPSAELVRHCRAVHDASDVASKPWHKVASINVGGTYQDRTAIFLVTARYRTRGGGILAAHVRTTGTAGTAEDVSLRWIVRSSQTEFNSDRFQIRYTNNTGSSKNEVTVEIWCKIETQYFALEFDLISANDRHTTNGSHDLWTLNNDTTGSASYTTGTGGAASVIAKIANNSSQAIGAKSANGYYGMTDPDLADNVWIRTTSNGIIPYQSGGAGSGHGSLGTSTWYFANAYIDAMHGTADRATNSNNCKTTVTDPSSSTTYGIVFVADPNTSEDNTLRKSNDFRINHFRGAANTEGLLELVLGNSTAKTAANNSTGRLTLYNANGIYVRLNSGSATSSVDINLPSSGGTLALGPTTLFNGTAASAVTLSASVTGFTSLKIFCKNSAASEYFVVTIQAKVDHHMVPGSTGQPAYSAAAAGPDLFGMRFVVDDKKVTVSCSKKASINSSNSLANPLTIHILKVLGLHF